MIQGLEFRFPRFAAGLSRGLGDPVEEVLPATSPAEILEEEKLLGIPLPDSYKEFLQCTRGLWFWGGTAQLSEGHPFFHDFPSLEELTPTQRRTLAMKGNVWPPPSQGMLCFAELFIEADGDQVLFDVSKGLVDGEYPVYYYAHEDHPPSVKQLTAGFRVH
jgi:hypothetical protein